MWGQGDRAIIVLVSVLSGFIILFNIWGSFIGLTIFIPVVISASIVLLANDDLSTLTLLTFDSINQAGENIAHFAKIIYDQSTVYFNYLLELLKTFYKEQIALRMERHRRNTYQLSTESLINSSTSSQRSSSQLGFIDGLSPISKSPRSARHSREMENDSDYSRKNLRTLKHARSFDKIQYDQRDPRHGDVNSELNQMSWKRRSSMYFSDDPYMRGEGTIYSPEGSPWGTSISPKVKSRSQEAKTVQTVAGPLLSSTRFNIDSKVYSDVTSPGLTSRLTKYANEANNKLIHQSQYSIGQFPKVNLNCSPTPLINAKSGKLRTPVTVRIAPPETVKYSPPEKQKILSNICRSQNDKSSSVVQVLKEISLKRHASRDDVSLELIKKQKTDGIPEEFENYDEISQKRTREDLSRSDDEISVEGNTRPNKRTKIPSCYDILNSLSSSTSVITSGTKRKADVSRSGTPELGKHFKSVDSNNISKNIPSPRISSGFVNLTRGANKIYSDVDLVTANEKDNDKSLSPQSGSLQSFLPQDRLSLRADKNSAVVKNVPIKLTDRLFMKAEPQNIDKLKSLIEEHGNMTQKFSSDDSDEIKKSDIINMRQTSMKARLKSMFDAISGKTSKQIDPNVVIQAESVTPRSSTTNLVSTSPALATLNSCTSTTTVNTSPISTSAVVPIIGKSKSESTPAKHVTFQLSTASSSTNSSVITTALPTMNIQKSDYNVKKSDAVTRSPQLMSFLTPVNNKTTQPSFSFGNNVTTTSSAVATTASATPITINNSIMMTPLVNPITLAITTATPSVIFTPQTPASSVASTSVSTSTGLNVVQPAKSDSSVSNFGTPAQNPVTTESSAPMFSFGTSSSSNSVAVQPTSSMFSAATSLPIKSQFNFTASSTTASPLTTTSNTLTVKSKSGLFSGASNNSTILTPTRTMPSFAFGTTIVATQPSQNFSFTSTTASGQDSNVNKSITQVEVKPISTATPMFSFGSNTSTTTPAFGLTTALSTPLSAPSTLPTSSLAIPKPIFSFITPSTSTAAPAPLTFGDASQPSGSGFGSTTAQSTQSTLSFITSTSPASSPSSTITASSIFGTSNQPVQPPVFASATGSSGASGGVLPFQVSKTSEAPTFGTNTTNSSTSNIFNGTSPAITSSTSMFSGGTSIFGQTKAPSFGTTTVSSFGTGTVPAFGSGSTSFGVQSTTATVTPAFGSSGNTTSSFGTSSSKPLPSFNTIGSSAPTFGTPNSTTTTFGSSSTVGTSFGNSSATVTPFRGTSSTSSTVSKFNTGTPTFGAATTSAAPTFGSNTASGESTSASFGANAASTSFGPSTSSGFSSGGSNTTLPMFGGSNTAFSGFGTSSTSSTTSPFAAANTSSTPAFGASTSAIPAFGASTSNSTSSTFAFTNTANQSQAPQQSSVFNFGVSGSGSSGSGSTSGSTPFQFGASTSQTGGFNFSGGPQLSGSFSAPAPSQGSMFSIGSGSTAPKSRTRLQRRQR